MSNGDLEKARKTFRGHGYTVVILGLVSLLFISGASEKLVAATVVGIGFCVVTGIWLVVRPAVRIGVAAGVSLTVLGILDMLLALETGAGLAIVAPLIDWGYAVVVFVGCRRYARALAG